MGTITKIRVISTAQTGKDHEIGTNRNGTQFAIPTYGGMYVYDSNYNKITTIGQYAGGQPIGVVYDPRRDIVYCPWAGTNEIRAFETSFFAQIGTYDFEQRFQSAGNYAYGQGRIVTSVTVLCYLQLLRVASVMFA